jgi:hypothetical protein
MKWLKPTFGEIPLCKKCKNWSCSII